jgi:hypothetical protein
VLEERLKALVEAQDTAEEAERALKVRGFGASRHSYLMV